MPESENIRQRAALSDLVTAETERCAGIDPLTVRCPTCSESQLHACRDRTFNVLRNFHSARWRAAIRTTISKPLK